MTEARGIAVIGAGGHGKVVISVLQAAGRHVAAVYDDNEALWGDDVLGIPVAGGVEALGEADLRRAILAIGDNHGRARLDERLGLDWQVALHPHAWVHESARVGSGSVVCAGAILQPDARIGRHSIVNTGASIDHDCDLGDFVHVAPGSTLAGAVRVGEGAFLGVGCSIVPGVRIGAWSTVAAGAMVIEDVEPGATVKGVPAR